MRPSTQFVPGTFFGADLEPGTFHGGTVEAGTFHGRRIHLPSRSCSPLLDGAGPPFVHERRSRPAACSRV
jgi:hypothetical protein